ncbi:MAG: RNB domain-containing ribonuclease [Silvibacterium sp.]
MTDRELLRQIERSPGQRAGYKQLVREFSLGGGRERRLLLEHLARLTAAGHLLKTDREQWAIPKAPAKAGYQANNLVAGRLDLHRDGFGFVRPPRGDREDDIFIPPNEVHDAMQGDQVLVELMPSRNDGRKLGRIVRVLTRRNTTVIGTFHYAREGRGSENFGGNYVTPFDDRMNQPILIPFDAEMPKPRAASANPHRVLGEEATRSIRNYDGNNLEGLVVDVEITSWPTSTRSARGRVIEVLGHEADFGIDVEMVIRKHHLPRIFPDKVLVEARAVAHLDPEVIASRRDFRDLPIVTIDGETARDFDDAVLVEHDSATGYWHLQVHIADVAHYVTPGTALDLEARLRGNSVYFPDRAIPMLPQELSTDICSLRPGEDRLVLSCLMNIDAGGNVLDYEVTEGVIRSARRMTYTQVHNILEGDERTRAEFADSIPAFERMKQLAEILNHKRDRRGSIDFDLPEPIIEFDEFGAMKSVTRSTRNWAHRLIEEFMLSANECVASWIETLGVPSLYRIHEKPEPRRIVEFEDIAASFGYSLGLGNLPVRKFQTRGERREHQRRDGDRGRSNPRQHEVPEDIPVTPRMYQKLTAKIAGKPEERILSYLMLRSLKQARYSEKNEGHFALAAPCYTHFTSPIRRYPDLIVHRIAKALLDAGVSGHGHLVPGEPHAKQGSEHRAQRSEEHLGATSFAPAAGANGEMEIITETDLNLIAQECSESERRAADAERELVEWKKIKFMRDRVGEDFDAMILSATKYGLFVELGDLFVEGLVPIQTLGTLDNDYYTFRENTREIIGERWGRRFRIGQRVRVLLDRIDAAQRRLQFLIIEDEAQGTDAGAPPLRSKQAHGWDKKKPSSSKSKPNNKSKSKAAKPSMQRQAPKPHPFPKKKKTKPRK